MVKQSFSHGEETLNYKIIKYLPRHLLRKELEVHPRRKDILVEVDWMVEMEDKAQFLVVKAFANHNIGLHIDDGCMGGGESIGYPNDGTLYFDSHSCSSDDDYFDFRGRDTNNNGKIDSTEEVINPSTGDPYFKGERSTVFHYCIIANYVRAEGNTDRTGRAKPPGTQFMLADGNIGSTDHFAKVFIHELGHNLGLKHPNNNDKMKDLNPLNDPDRDTSMYTGYATIVDYTTSNSQSRAFNENPLSNGKEWRYVSENLDNNLSMTKS